MPALVVLGRRDVVRPIGVEHGREPLDLAAPRTELELPAAVHADTALFALLDALEEAAQRPEARRLDVEPARLDRQLADVVPRVDRRVEAEAILRSREGLAAPVLEPCVLDHHVREALDHQAVLLRIGREIDRRPAVVRLQVEDAHAIGRSEPLHQRAIPVLPHVQLELELGVQLAVRLDLGARGRDEADGLELTPENVGERAPGLPQREVERGALERPAPVVARRAHLRLAVEELELVQPDRVVVQRPRAGEHLADGKVARDPPGCR